MKRNTKVDLSELNRKNREKLRKFLKQRGRPGWLPQDAHAQKQVLMKDLTRQLSELRQGHQVKKSKKEQYSQVMMKRTTAAGEGQVLRQRKMRVKQDERQLEVSQSQERRAELKSSKQSLTNLFEGDSVEGDISELAAFDSRIAASQLTRGQQPSALTRNPSDVRLPQLSSLEGSVRERPSAESPDSNTIQGTARSPLRLRLDGSARGITILDGDQPTLASAERRKVELQDPKVIGVNGVVKRAAGKHQALQVERQAL